MYVFIPRTNSTQSSSTKLTSWSKPLRLPFTARSRHVKNEWTEDKKAAHLHALPEISPGLPGPYTSANQGLSLSSTSKYRSIRHPTLVGHRKQSWQYQNERTMLPTGTGPIRRLFGRCCLVSKHSQRIARLCFADEGLRLHLGLCMKKEEEEIIRLPWRGQCGRAAAARALCACCAAGYAKDCTGSPVCF
jgi:hypothetical protein